MQTLQSSTLRRLPRQLSQVTKATTTTPKLSRPFSTHPATMSTTGTGLTRLLNPDLTTPLFRLLDDYDRSASQVMHQAEKQMRTFTPRFDVRETDKQFELHGEFPGIEQKDIAIEWMDTNTLTIKGHVEHHYEEGSPQGFIEEGDGSDTKKLQPRVEDENEGKNTAVSKKGKHEMTKHRERRDPRFWISERSVGEFSRTFTFPHRVEQDKVKASLKNGVLSVIIPKAQALKSKKIQINVE